MKVFARVKFYKYKCSIISKLYIDAHRGWGGKGEGKYSTLPQANFKTLVNKNAIKPEIGGIFPENIDPPSPPPPPTGILAKTVATHSPEFSTRVHQCPYR